MSMTAVYGAVSGPDSGRKVVVYTRRVEGPGRLLTIANILNVPVTVFFEGAKATRGGHSPLELLAEKDAYNLAAAFSKIKD